MSRRTTKSKLEKAREVLNQRAKKACEICGEYWLEWNDTLCERCVLEAAIFCEHCVGEAVEKKNPFVGVIGKGGDFAGVAVGQCPSCGLPLKEGQEAFIVPSDKRRLGPVN